MLASYSSLNQRRTILILYIIISSIVVPFVFAQTILALNTDKIGSDYHYNSDFIETAALNFMLFISLGVGLLGVDYSQNKKFFANHWKSFTGLLLASFGEFLLYFLVFAVSVEFANRALLGVLSLATTPDGFILRSVGGAGGIIDSLILGFFILLTGRSLTGKRE